MKAGEEVTWVSQSGGFVRRKTGTLLGYIPLNKSGFDVLRDLNNGDVYFISLNRSKIKFQDYNMVYERAIVEVPRGGKSVLSDFYAPNVNLLKKIEQPELLEG